MKSRKSAGGHVRIGGRALGKIADVPFRGDRLRRDVVAADDRRAGGRREKTGDHLHRRRLAGAVRAEKAQHLALRHRKGDIVDGDQRAERFDEMSDLQHTSASSDDGPFVPSRGAPAIKKSGSRDKRFRNPALPPDGLFDDPATAAFFRSGDARLCDDASPQPRRRPDLARGDGRRAVVHLPHLVEPPGAGAALRQLSRPLRAGAVGIVAAAQLAAARRPSSARSFSALRSRSCSPAMSSARESPTISSTPTPATTLTCCGSISSAFPEHGYLQMLVLVVAWSHAMIGLHFWLRVRPWYSRLQPAALVLAVLVPVLSLLGMIEAGRQVAALAADPNWTREAFARMTLPSPETRRDPRADHRWPQLVFRRRRRRGSAGADRAPRLAPPARRRADRLPRWPLGRGHARHQRARGEPDRRDPARLGMRRPRPLLDLPRAGARRSPQPSIRPSANELRVLRRIGARPNIRLACMLRPRGAVEVTPLLPPLAHCRRRTAAGSISCRAASARSRSCSPTSAASPRSPRAGFPMMSCSSSTAISRRWDARSKAREGASTSSSATGSWRCSASRAAPRPAAARRSPPRG